MARRQTGSKKANFEPRAQIVKKKTPMIFWVSSSWSLAPPQSLILTAHHLEHRKGETESKGKETIKKEIKREQKHAESEGNGKGWGHLDRKQGSRRYCKHKTSILLYPLFHSFLKSIFFSLLNTVLAFEMLGKSLLVVKTAFTFGEANLAAASYAGNLYSWA